MAAAGCPAAAPWPLARGQLQATPGPPATPLHQPHTDDTTVGPTGQQLHRRPHDLHDHRAAQPASSQPQHRQELVVCCWEPLLSAPSRYVKLCGVGRGQSADCWWLVGHHASNAQRRRDHSKSTPQGTPTHEPRPPPGTPPLHNMRQAEYRHWLATGDLPDSYIDRELLRCCPYYTRQLQSTPLDPTRAPTTHGPSQPQAAPTPSETTCSHKRGYSRRSVQLRWSGPVVQVTGGCLHGGHLLWVCWGYLQDVGAAAGCCCVTLPRLLLRSRLGLPWDCRWPAESCGSRWW